MVPRHDALTAAERAAVDAWTAQAIAEADVERWKARYEEQLAGTRQVDDLRMAEIRELNDEIKHLRAEVDAIGNIAYRGANAAGALDALAEIHRRAKRARDATPVHLAGEMPGRRVAVDARERLAKHLHLQSVLPIEGCRRQADQMLDVITGEGAER